MKEALLISICIPAYNAAKFIGETLNSIKHQTYTYWELIVVEDGSDDGTRELVDQFRQEVRQDVIYFHNPQNLGLPATRNVGASLSSGSWIAFVDSDDLWDSNHLTDLINTANDNPDCGLIHSGVTLFQSETGTIISTRAPEPEAIEHFPVSLFDRTYRVQPSSIMISRTLFKVTKGFREDLKYVEDLEMWIRCAREGFKFAFTGKNTCLYRQHRTGAMTNNGLAMALGSARVFDIHSDWEKIPKNIRYKQAAGQWFAVTRIARKSDKVLAENCLSKSMQYDLTVRQLLFWLLIKLS